MEPQCLSRKALWTVDADSRYAGKLLVDLVDSRRISGSFSVSILEINLSSVCPGTNRLHAAEVDNPACLSTPLGCWPRCGHLALAS